MEIADLRKSLCENESESFSDVHLLEKSVPVVRMFKELNLGDEARPAKRRRKAIDSAEDTDASMYAQLVTVLNGSTHESPVLNLANLHNILQ